MDDDLRLTFVVGYHCSGDKFDLSGDDALRFALDQRAFGPRRLLVLTAREDGQVIGLAHCERIDPPEVGLKCCLAALDDGAAAAIAYSDEPVGLDDPPDLEERFAAARDAAAESGVHLVDWIVCDDIHLRSMRCTLEDPDEWWDLPVDRSSRR